MAESSTLMMNKARDLLATPSHEGLAILIDQLFMPRETEEYKSARAVYEFCVKNFANCLALNLLQVYRFSSDGVVRLRSICLLATTLSLLRNRNGGFELSLVALNEIKPLLVSCLMMEDTKESDVKILRRIVSFVADDVLRLDNGGWDELSDCILELANSDLLKAFHVFVDLPPLDGRFIYRFMQRILEKAKKVLLNPKGVRVQDWSLCLETVVKMGIQLLGTETRFDLIKNLLSLIVKSASELVEKGMEQFLLRGLDDLERFLSRDKELCHYNKDQCLFVSTFIFKIRGLGTHTKEAAKKISRLVKSGHNPATKLIQPQVNQDHGAGFERERFNDMNSLSPLEILRIFASTDIEERYIDMAFRRLNLLLSDHTSRKVRIDVSVMRQLQPLLISCLYQEGISDSMFKVLVECVYHVAYEMMIYQVETWYGLRDYITSKSKTEFERAVYIFQCLTMWLEDEEFVVPVMENLLPEISLTLSPPIDLLVDNSCWVLAFVGAFCAIIRSIEITSQAESVKEIEGKMIDSVRELVERGMEVGLVRRAFRDLETIVKRQEEWYRNDEYRYLKGLLWNLYAIECMEMESKMVLWQINVMAEKGMAELAKELQENELAWMKPT